MFPICFAYHYLVSFSVSIPQIYLSSIYSPKTHRYMYNMPSLYHQPDEKLFLKIVIECSPASLHIIIWSLSLFHFLRFTSAQYTVLKPTDIHTHMPSLWQKAFGCVRIYTASHTLGQSHLQHVTFRPGKSFTAARSRNFRKPLK